MYVTNIKWLAIGSCHRLFMELLSKKDRAMKELTEWAGM